MRRLAQALDVWPMALYRYFEDKDALLDAIVDRAADDVERPGGEGTWQERIRGLLGGVRDALGPEVSGDRLSRALATPGVARLSREGVAILREAGFAANEAKRAWQALLSYTVGASALATEDGFEYGLARMLDGLAAGLTAAA